MIAPYVMCGAAIANGRRADIPRDYHPDGALVLLNGDAMRSNAAELRPLAATRGRHRCHSSGQSRLRRHLGAPSGRLCCRFHPLKSSRLAAAARPIE